MRIFDFATLIALALISPSWGDDVAMRAVCQNIQYHPKDNTKNLIVRTEIELVRADDGLTLTDFKVTHYTALGSKYVRSEQYSIANLIDSLDDGTRPNKSPVVWMGYREANGQDWQMTGEFFDDGFGHFVYRERLWKSAANPRDSKLVMTLTATCH
jgi:hypothetical protein